MITKHISKGRRVMTGLLVVGPAIATVLLVVGLARAAEGSFADSILTTYRDMPSAKADWNASGKAKLASSSSISVTTLTVTLPISAYLTSAVYVPSSHRAYIFGGRDPSLRALNDVVEYDIARGTIAVTATLPISTYGTSAVYVPSDHKAYIFGGRDPSAGVLKNDIVEYDITDSTAIMLSATLPISVYLTSAVYVPYSHNAYVFGGRAQGTTVDDIVRINFGYEVYLPIILKSYP